MVHLCYGIGVCVLGKGMVLRRDAAMLTGFQHEQHDVECRGAYVIVRLKVCAIYLTIPLLRSDIV
jgi:hypothetical protein